MNKKTLATIVFLATAGCAGVPALAPDASGTGGAGGSASGGTGIVSPDTGKGGSAGSPVGGAAGNLDAGGGGRGGAGGTVDAARDSAGSADATSDSGGTDTATPEANKFGEEIDGFRIEVKCLGDAFVTNRVCNVTAAVDRQSYTRRFGGALNTIYNVTLRVRGVVEPMTYMGGTRTGRFYVGGVKKDSEWNIYSMNVADPKQLYFFNAADATAYDIAAIDYEVTVKIRGGSGVTLGVNGQNQATIANFKKVVAPGIPPAPEAFNGQLIQFNVISVAPVP